MVPNHILLIAVDHKHRYGARALEVALNRAAAHLEKEEIEEALEWTQVATVLAEELCDQAEANHPHAHPAHPTPL